MKKKMIKRLVEIEKEIFMMRMEGGVRMGKEMDALRAVAGAIIIACRVLGEDQKEAA